jgi:hypothetical protein
LPACAIVVSSYFAPGGSMPGGHSSNCMSSSVISYQGALDPTKMWATGRTPGSSSSVPSATPTLSGYEPNIPASGDPQRLQKYLKPPGDDSYFDRRFSPATQQNSDRFAVAYGPNAAPCVLRQIEQ